jgi:cytochrome bd ubiquinol oxidase subunit I
MDGLLFARLQFGATTIYHFFFVPVSIGLALYLAMMQTAWYRTGKPKYLKIVKFWSKPFLICFAVGVVTGIVLEFQIGMNWSEYSRFVGDVFGAPLAMEALLAFFVEATFIGLWIFGWDRLPKGVHLVCIWMVAIGTNLSAYFIITANSWMQYPVGFTYNSERGRAELTDFGAILTNKVALAAYPHIVAGAALSAAAVVIAISAWHLARGAHIDVMRTSLRFGFAAAVLAGIGTTITGDIQGKVMTEVQPMKMAAAEALWDSQSQASFSIFTIGTRDATHEVFSVRVPYLLSYISHGDIHATVEGINDVQAEYERIFGPGDYRPHIPTTYWSFRYMIGLGAVTTALGLLGLWLTRRGRLPDNPWFWRILIWTSPLPILANAFGWIFTEMGRQPWIVFGEMFTRDALSPVTPAWQVLTSLAVFTAIYAALAVVAVRLLFRYTQAGLPPDEPESADTDGEDRRLTFAY